MTDLRVAALAAGAVEYNGGPHFSWEQLRNFVAALAQQEQAEPVAWIHRKHYLLGHAKNMPSADRALAQGWEPLYTTPPRREWQGLKEEKCLKAMQLEGDEK
jgi:hypothetical protein